MKIRNVVPVEPESIFADAHVPLKVRWTLETMPLAHVRTGDLLHTILDFGIDPSTGAIRQLTLVLPGRSQSGGPRSLSDLPAVRGVPVVDLPAAADVSIDEPQPLQVYKAERRLLIVIGKDRPIRKVIATERVRFGVDVEDDIAAIEVCPLTAAEEVALASSLDVEGDEGTPPADTAPATVATSSGQGSGELPQWIEIWIESCSRGEYLFSVRGFADGRVVVTDPQHGGREVATFDAYEEAVHWLGEEEFDPVEGRWTPL